MSMKTLALRISYAFFSGALALVLLALLGARPAAAQQAQEEPSEEEKAMNYSLYYESFKNGDYKSAMPYLRWILERAPAYAGPGRLSDRNIERAIEAYEGLAAAAEDPELKRAYLDTALAWFDKAVPTLKQAGMEDVDEYQWLLEKGRFIQEHQEDLPDLQDEALALYRQAYEIDPERMQPYYIKLIIYDYIRQGDKQGAVDFMEEVEQIHGEDADLAEYIAQQRNSLFRSPEERMEFLEQQLEKDPQNVELIAELFEIYRELQYRQKMYEMGQRLSELDPSARTYQLLGQARLEDGEAEEALKLYEQALEMEGAERYRRDIYYNMGVAYQQMGRLSNARTYYRRALQEDSNFGPALIGIGDLYVTAVAECGGSKMDREDQAVYWLAADYYERARRVDPSVANQANLKLRSITPYFPDAEAKFFKKWETGQPLAINYGCYEWINETTTVR
ncbi:MAG: tetratricopeptide repeat protein [Bacteroidetes bacterium]|nr:MAG: tetratricopeptide repeat protein [Bacteroidota bacterium]